MKNINFLHKNYAVTLMLGFAVLLFSCSDDDIDLSSLENLVPVTSKISGPVQVDVNPLSNTYSIPLRQKSTYAWSVSGTGTIVGEATGNSVNVSFGSEGSSTLTIVETNVGGSGTPQTLEITSAAGTPGVSSISSLSTAPLKSGTKDTVVVVYNRAIATAPSATLVTNPELVEFGTLGQAEGQKITAANAAKFGVGEDDLAAYFWEYTAGAGDVSPSISISGAVADASWGGKAQVSASSGSLTATDNTAPTGKLSYSSELAKEGDSDIVITVTFGEGIDPTSVVMIDWTGNNVPAFNGSLAVDKDDNKVWTTKYTPSTGNDVLNFTVTGAVDLAGNAQGSIADATIEIDNTKPTIGGSSAVEYELSGVKFQYAILDAASNEKGMVYWIVVPDGTDGTNDALGSAIDMSNPSRVRDGSIAVELGSTADSGGGVNIATGILTAGAYDVYFYSEDEAGNESTVSTKIDLTID